MTIKSLNENGHIITQEEDFKTPKPVKRSYGGIIISIGFFLVVTAIILYFTFAPTVCPVDFSIAGNVVSAPVNGKVVMIHKAGAVKKGDVVAEIIVPPNSDAAFLENVYLARERLQNLTNLAQERYRALEKLDGDLAEIKSELTQAKTELAMATEDEKHSEQQVKLKQERLAAANRLLQLDAIRNSDYEVAQEAVNIAESERVRNALQRQKNQERVQALERKFETETREKSRLEQSYANDERDYGIFQQQLQQSLSEIEFLPEGVKMKLYAGIDGVVCEPNLNVGGNVRTGDPLLTILPENDSVLAVYLPEDMAAEVKADSTFRISLGGETFTVMTERLTPVMETLPRRLRHRVSNPDALYRKIILKKPDLHTTWLDGQTGSGVLL